MELNVISRAKLNLTLRVLGRVKGGYHALNSVAVPLSICDDVRIRLRSRATPCSVTTEFYDKAGAGISEGELANLNGPKNLCYRAAEMILAAAGAEDYGFEIELKKRIPLQAGLGGGSVNAAATLWAINELLGKPKTQRELQQLGAGIGADVAVGLSSGPAFMHGTGGDIAELVPTEKFRQMCSKFSLLLVKPPDGVDTASAYRDLGFPAEPHIESSVDEARTRVELRALGLQTPGDFPLTLNVAEGSHRSAFAGDWLQALTNDFERVVFPRREGCGVAAQRLIDVGADRMLLCGSGSTVAGFFSEDSKTRVEDAAERCRLLSGPGWWIEVARIDDVWLSKSS